jgi:hypothetical protein
MEEYLHLFNKTEGMDLDKGRRKRFLLMGFEILLITLIILLIYLFLSIIF